MKKHLVAQLQSMKKGAAKAAVVAGAALPVLAHADGAAQPDTSTVITYIAGGVATVLAVFVAKYGVKGAILIARWVQGVIAR